MAQRPHEPASEALTNVGLFLNVAARVGHGRPATGTTNERGSTDPGGRADIFICDSAAADGRRTDP